MKRRVDIIITYILLVLFAIFFLTPIYVLLATSLKNFEEVSISTMWKLPTRISFDGFIEAFQKLKMNLKNSFLLVIPATLISSF